MSTEIEAGKGWYYGFGDQRGYRVTFTDREDWQNYMQEIEQEMSGYNRDFIKKGEEREFVIDLPPGNISAHLYTHNKEGIYEYQGVKIHYENAQSASIPVYARPSYTEVRLEAEDMAVYEIVTNGDVIIEELQSSKTVFYKHLNVEGIVVIDELRPPPTIVYKLIGPEAVLTIQQKGVGELKITNQV